MPLKFEWRKLAENAFWIAIFVAAFIAMQKAMHPGWTLLGW